MYNNFMPRRTRTSAFGVSRRENHDSSQFYERSLYASPGRDQNDPAPVVEFPLQVPSSDWIDHIYQQSSESLPIPDSSIGLAFTSPPYNVGKEYDANLSLDDYLRLIQRVAGEVFRVLQPGGRYVVNIANLGRKPYIPLHSFFYSLHTEVGFLPMGEIIWQKSKGANGSCAWGSWRSARSPRLRDLHEYLLVFAKGTFSRPEKGISDITDEEFMQSTLSVWQIPSVSAKKVGHPAPFPLELAERVIRLYSFVGDTILDPFVGSGTTCVAAKLNNRHFVGFDISPEYVELTEKRLNEI